MAENLYTGEVQLTDEQKSKLNSGGLINVRINNLWEKVHRRAESGNYLGWNVILDRIWCELAGDLPAGSPEEKEFNRLCMQIWSAGKLFQKPKSGFVPFDSQEFATIAKQYFYLQKKEIFLRRLQNKQGKGTAYVEDEDWWE